MPSIAEPPTNDRLPYAVASGPGIDAKTTGLRVLIAEDEAVIAGLLAETLTMMGYEICAIVANEADAVAAASRHRPDLLIVDAQLGGGSGVLAVETILRAGPVAYLFTSGAMVASVRPDAVVLRKPFFQAELERAIQLAFDAAASSSGGKTLQR